MRRIRTVFTGVAGTPWYSNLYFDASTTGSQQVVANVWNFWNTIKGQIDTRVTATVQGLVPIINDATGDIVRVESYLDVPLDCNGSGNVLPQADQTMLNLLTGTYTAGRQLRGRLFIPGLISAAANGDGTVAANFLAAQIDAAEDLRDAAVVTGAWLVWSRKNGTSDTVQSITGKTTFAVLRSRRD